MFGCQCTTKVLNLLFRIENCTYYLYNKPILNQFLLIIPHMHILIFIICKNWQFLSFTISIASNYFLFKFCERQVRLHIYLNVCFLIVACLKFWLVIISLLSVFSQFMVRNSYFKPNKFFTSPKKPQNQCESIMQ